MSVANICKADYVMGLDFADWLQGELDKRGWKQANLVRGGVNSSYVSQVLNRLRNPGPKFCRQVAKALNLPEQEVYEQAGLLKGLPQGDKETEEYVQKRLPLISPVRQIALRYFLDHLVEAERIEREIDRDVSALSGEDDS